MERQRLVLEQAAWFARSVHEHDTSGHDWPHIERVVRMARIIAEAESANPFMCELAALLHDVADEKLNASKEAGMGKVSAWLDGQPLEPAERAEVLDIIGTMSFAGGASEPMRSIEGWVVRDADRLDALGAIGIARTFAYAGRVGYPLYDPELPPRLAMTKEQYRHGKTTAINHFYEKLLKLKSLLYTDTARAMAEQRHRVMEAYVEQFLLEWNG
ncbi:MAG: hypothetical protein K0Q59_3887 [Paenibacillus sp.]|jgi:uncharacterized protein|nr:hypothetical protein [Paenibacillus sp.]